VGGFGKRIPRPAEILHPFAIFPGEQEIISLLSPDHLQNQVVAFRGKSDGAAFTVLCLARIKPDAAG
jgi:hypothetical protein